MSRVLIVLIACGKKEIAVKNAAKYPKIKSVMVGLARFELATSSLSGMRL